MITTVKVEIFQWIFYFVFFVNKQSVKLKTNNPLKKHEKNATKVLTYA